MEMYWTFDDLKHPYDQQGEMMDPSCSEIADRGFAETQEAYLEMTNHYWPSLVAQVRNHLMLALTSFESTR